MRRCCTERGFGDLSLTRLVTAASELTRNLLRYAGRGEVGIAEVCDAERVGLQVRFDDVGPGIEDLEAALADGFSSSDGLGLGLGGARRLVDEFEIVEHSAAGTRILLTQWKTP